jgi:CheY-like chemotaxis protein/HPt (histidine-containing phosphotransfer) domain-containing protein
LYALKDSFKHSGKALIVDDNTINQLLITVILSEMGYDTLLASNGLEAFRYTQEQFFKIIIMDIQMPVMDGYTSVKKIREMETRTGKKSLIIGLTAYAMKGNKEKVLQSGFDFYIAKPFKRDELIEAINHLVGCCEHKCKSVKKDSHFSLHHFLRKFHSDLPFIQNLYENFTIITNEMLEKIDASISEQNAEEILLATHKLKGSLSMMECMQGVYYIDEMEAQVKEYSFVEARVSFVKILREINKVVDQISGYLSLHAKSYTS